jgi:hypothetical protein
LFEATVQASVGLKFGGYAGLVSSLIISLAQYGVFVTEQSFQIKETLEDSEYHYHMMIYFMKKKEELLH